MVVQSGIRQQMEDRRNWLDEALRRLGREILDEEVPERLRRILRDAPAAPRDRPSDADKRDPPPKPPRGGRGD